MSAEMPLDAERPPLLKAVLRYHVSPVPRDPLAGECLGTAELARDAGTDGSEAVDCGKPRPSCESLVRASRVVEPAGGDLHRPARGALGADRPACGREPRSRT